MSIKDTRIAINQLGLRCDYRDGEYRVTYWQDELKPLFPTLTREQVKAKAEHKAYYTADAADAIDTAERMADEMRKMQAQARYARLADRDELDLY